MIKELTMLSFKEYLLIESQQYPAWVKGTVLFLIMKIRSIENQIKTEKDVSKKLNLLSQQTKFNSLINTLGIAIDTKDKSLVKRY